MWIWEICSVVEQSWKETEFKNNNQTNPTVTTRISVLPTEWTRTWLSTGLVSEWNWMVDVVLQGVWILSRITKDEDDESRFPLAFWRDAVNVIFLRHSNEGRILWSHVGIWNIPSDVCYDDKSLPGEIWTQAYYT